MATATKAKAPSKSEVLANIAESTGLTKKQVASVLDAVTEEIKKALGKKGAGVFQIPGLVKIQKIHKPAQPERKGVNPFTKEPTVFKAKPARNVVKVRPLKNLKSLV